MTHLRRGGPASARLRRIISDTLLVASACTIALTLVTSRGIGVLALTPRASTAIAAALALLLGASGLRFRRPLASPGFRTGHIVLYEGLMWPAVGRRTPPLAMRGPRDAIERFIPSSDWRALFDRRALWRPSSHPTAELPGEALGVWGRRKCKRLRRILRERGATIEVRREAGPPQTLGNVSRSWSW